ncbi:PD-(D/E)XK nuclease family protein [Paenibacillus barcinonensis]|uniref:helicase C-terminal domain-containing protein n=1 Tax=Paenibacillus barcinonensis TaxID=198119 RepID=UPI001C0F7F93|nr:helicase C-terminal domain-containing protein [Paenibacillus barcinonensis]MBU5352791.1 PD-(D/E)XK nuclease family protein [Paenibacillus barcinonensis]
MTTTIRISVRPLVEYVYRSGSIRPGFRTNASMQEGTRIHQRVQKAYAEEDLKEIVLEAELRHGELTYVIEGRCDGLIRLEGQLTVDEIKSTAGNLDELDGGLEVHWAQAMMYAYMYAVQHDEPCMQVQLTYVHSVTGEERRFRRMAERQELEQFAAEVIAGYAPYAEMIAAYEAERDVSVRELPFPFRKYREGQRKLAGAVYKTIREGQGLMAKAPTGIGKTMSVLFPTVKAIGEGEASRLFYLTARTTTRVAAEEAFARMQAEGLKMHVISLTAKDKICFKDEEACDTGQCGMCEGYYDRINGAVLDMLKHETLMTRPVIEQYARKHRVCPFEFSLDAAYAADAVICDYNYIFDPRISLKRMLEEQKRKTVLLVDEAHNLVDRGRMMFSAELEKAVFLDVKREFQTLGSHVPAAKAIVDYTGAIDKYLITLRKNGGEEGKIIQQEAPEELIERLEPFILVAEQCLVEGGSGNAETDQLLLDAYFTAQNFVRIAKLYDERFITYAECVRSEVRVKLFCLDPSEQLRQTAKGFRSTIHFSATLSPLRYYRDMLGAEDEDYTLQIPSPFSREQLDVRLMPLSVRYKDRERTKRPIAEMLQQLVSEWPHSNLLVFFPSYPYMREVYEAYAQLPGAGDADTVMQEQGMNEQEREQFLAAFQPHPERTRLVFAVMGGVFSEGVDLPGDRLNGVVVVGAGLPQIGLENNVLRDYFDKSGRNGFNYAYVFPGMNKVLQAGGRLIRTEEDKGVLVLVDDRFTQEPYRSLLPEEWLDYKRI